MRRRHALWIVAAAVLMVAPAAAQQAPNLTTDDAMIARDDSEDYWGVVIPEVDQNVTVVRNVSSFDELNTDELQICVFQDQQKAFFDAFEEDEGIFNGESAYDRAECYGDTGGGLFW
jgi:hypothetical protein